MKYTFFLATLSILLISACNNAPDRPDPMLDPNYQPTETSNNNSTTFTNAGSTGSSVYHYICPNNCGGGDAAGNCPICGSAYTHNQAFHSQNTANTTPTPSPDNPNVTTTTPPPSNEPPQNAAGVWHYTCPNNCSGGAGSAVACASCGTTLTHNTLYHQ